MTMRSEAKVENEHLLVEMQVIELFYIKIAIRTSPAPEKAFFWF